MVIFSGLLQRPAHSRGLTGISHVRLPGWDPCLQPDQMGVDLEPQITLSVNPGLDCFHSLKAQEIRKQTTPQPTKSRVACYMLHWHDSHQHLLQSQSQPIMLICPAILTLRTACPCCSFFTDILPGESKHASWSSVPACVPTTKELQSHFSPLPSF